MIEKCLLWREKAKKYFGGRGGSPPFLHSSILFSTAVPNFRAEIMSVLLLVSKSGTSASTLKMLSHLRGLSKYTTTQEWGIGRF